MSQFKQSDTYDLFSGTKPVATLNVVVEDRRDTKSKLSFMVSPYAGKPDSFGWTNCDWQQAVEAANGVLLNRGLRVSTTEIKAFLFDIQFMKG